mmetsp:Transcript_47350/g.78863  ORF Transcript_47350/g.78863 Transcript_47350/m.78863 type:complete len:306 (+) Transcript_47350:750-1667(+)
MQNVTASGRDVDVEDLAVRGRGFSFEEHFGEQTGDVLGGEFEAEDAIDVANVDLVLLRFEIGIDRDGSIRIHDLDLFDSGGVLAVLDKHGGDDVEDDLGLGAVGGGDLDKDVLGVEGDLGVVTVDDGWQRQDDVLAVIDDRVRRKIPDQREEGLQVQVRVEESHELLTVDDLGAVERGKLDLLGGEGLVGKGALDGVEIVRSDRDERPLPADVLVELVLDVNEALHVDGVEGDVAEDGAHDERTDGRDAGLDVHAERRRGCLEDRGLFLLEEDLQGRRDAFQAQEVIPVGSNFNLVDDFFFLARA